MFIEDVDDEKQIAIMVDDEWKPCWMVIRLGAPFNISTLDQEFPNARSLSASLACELGVGPARDLLHKHAVPQDSHLWDLNHHGYAPPQAS